METQRNYDLQAAERIFRKIVHPGLNTLKIDKDNYTFAGPAYGLRNSNKTYTLSPRGVPTRVSNHIYSGCQPSRFNGVNIGLDTQEMFSMVQKPQVASHSARLSEYTHATSLPSKKRAISSKTMRSMHMPKSASTDRYMSGLSSEKRQLKSAHSDYWNKSQQGERLDRKWSSVSSSRAMKRSSEIVSHRVDRMYFMSGNSIQLKPKYEVDEDELTRLREMTKSRQSSRSRQRNIVQVPNCGSRLSSHRLSSRMSVAKTEDIKLANGNSNQIDTDRSQELKTAGRKSPLAGWGNPSYGQDVDLRVQGEIIRKKSLHEEPALTNGDLLNHRPDGRLSRANSGISNDDKWKTRKNEEEEIEQSLEDFQSNHGDLAEDSKSEMNMSTMKVKIESREVKEEIVINGEETNKDNNEEVVNQSDNNQNEDNEGEVIQVENDQQENDVGETVQSEAQNENTVGQTIQGEIQNETEVGHAVQDEGQLETEEGETIQSTDNKENEVGETNQEDDPPREV